MLLPIDYQIQYVEGQYHLYVLVSGNCLPLYSSYTYNPCYQVMQCAKHMQKLVPIEGTT